MEDVHNLRYGTVNVIKHDIITVVLGCKSEDYEC